MVIESMHEKTEEAMAKLLQSLFRSFVITIEQMRNVSWFINTYCSMIRLIPSCNNVSPADVFLVGNRLSLT